MNLVVPFGFYGSGNIGDEATLNGFARLASQSSLDLRVAVGSNNPTHTGRVEPSFTYFRPQGADLRRWWAKYRAIGCVFAGGTPIMDLLGEWPLNAVKAQIQAAVRRQTPIVFVGVGTERLRDEKYRQIVAEHVAPFVNHWSVRCDHDRTRLIEYGVDPRAITVAADMAWLIEPSGKEFGRSQLRQLGLADKARIVAVNLVNENHLLTNHSTIASELAQSLDALYEMHGLRILFLSNEVRDEAGFDAAAARMVIEKMNHRKAAVLAPNHYFSPAEMMSIISCCEVSISMRYHFCLFSALQGVPFVALTRSDKVSDLCYDLSWNVSVKPFEVKHEQLIKLVNAARSHDAQALKDRVAHLRLRAGRNLGCLELLETAAPLGAATVAS